MRAEFRREHLAADVFQQPAHRNDVTYVRYVVQRNCLTREDRGRHAWERRIFCPANRHAPFQRLAAANAKLVHAERLKEKLQNREP